MKVTYKNFRLSGDLQCQSSRRHIPGKLLCTQTGYRGEVSFWICQRFITNLWTLWGPQVDLFVAYWNHKLTMFGSFFPDKVAWAVDALSNSWENMFYAQ